MSQIPANFTDGVFTITCDGGNSATLLLSAGDQSFSGIVPDGRQATKTESRGALVGVRKAARAYATISVSGTLHEALGDFQKLALGLEAGFVSTLADIGDYAGVDFDYSFDYAAESRDISGEDAILTDFTMTEGDSSTVSFTFEILGPVDIDGTAVVPSR